MAMDRENDTTDPEIAAGHGAASAAAKEGKILVITLGGTIEALYNPEEGTPEYVPVPQRVEDTAIPEALRRLGLQDRCDVYPLAMQDSKQVTTDSLDHIMDYMARSDYARVVIVQGTDTMPVHARYLKRRMAEWGAHGGMDEKTVLLTGAMNPLRDKHGQWRDPEGPRNDGWQNLRMAVADAAGTQPGVYVEIGNGPQEADTIHKYVELSEPDANGVRKVVRSGFMADNPARHREEGF